MCEKVEAALEVVKQSKKSLTKGEIVMVFQQVVYDLNKQGERMKSLEKNVEEMKTELANVKIDVQKILIAVEGLKREKKATFWDRIPLLGQIPTWFWIILWTVVLIIGGIFGVSPEFIRHIQTGG